VPNKVKKNQLADSSSRKIRSTPPKQQKPTGISFSFKFFNGSHDEFYCHDREINYWITFLDRLKDLSGLTALEMMNNRSSTLRCHPISWSDTSELAFGIPGEEQLVDMPYQFSLSSNAHGRIHGFFIEEIFYIVWLDPEHRLYPGK
jgi:hypothetical protein